MSPHFMSLTQPITLTLNGARAHCSPPTQTAVTFRRTKSAHAAAQPAGAPAPASSRRTRRNSGAATAQGAYSRSLRAPSPLRREN